MLADRCRFLVDTPCCCCCPYWKGMLECSIACKFQPKNKVIPKRQEYIDRLQEVLEMQVGQKQANGEIICKVEK